MFRAFWNGAALLSLCAMLSSSWIVDDPSSFWLADASSTASFCCKMSSLGLVEQTDFLCPLSFLLFLVLQASADLLLASTPLLKFWLMVALLIFFNPWSYLFCPEHKLFFPDLSPDIDRSGLSYLFPLSKTRSLIGVLNNYLDSAYASLAESPPTDFWAEFLWIETLVCLLLWLLKVNLSSLSYELYFCFWSIISYSVFDLLCESWFTFCFWPE